MIEGMATIHISEDDAVRDFARVLNRVRGGAEVVIEAGAGAVAIIRPAVEPRGRLLSESIALAEDRRREGDIEPVMDAEFASDIDEIIRSRKPRDTSQWG